MSIIYDSGQDRYIDTDLEDYVFQSITLEDVKNLILNYKKNEVERIMLADKAGLIFGSKNPIGDLEFIGNDKDWEEYEKLLNNRDKEIEKINEELGIYKIEESGMVYDDREEVNQLLKEEADMGII